jgi:hypothetical protein
MLPLQRSPGTRSDAKCKKPVEIHNVAVLRDEQRRRDPRCSN